MSETLDQVVEINIYLQPIQFILSIVLNIITIYILSSYTFSHLTLLFQSMKLDAD